jgi:predicted DNA-binding transcriptional regulator YafY
MSRAERLLELLQNLRNRRVPVAGPDLASELGISLRTLYRDIAALQAQGADIRGEAGVGYILRPGFTLPPLMFSPEELEALVLGSRWVAARADDKRLGIAAQQALSKIGAVLPPALRDGIDNATLLVAPRFLDTKSVDPGLIREAIRLERKLAIDYRNEAGETSTRTIWPICIAFFESVRIVTAWCELRDDFRSFRIDRIATLQSLEQRYPRRRDAMMREWRAREGLTRL